MHNLDGADKSRYIGKASSKKDLGKWEASCYVRSSSEHSQESCLTGTTVTTGTTQLVCIPIISPNRAFTTRSG